MNKTYTAPDIQYLDLDAITLLEASGVNSDFGIVYGGVDDEGVLDPSARLFNTDIVRHSVWDE